MNNAADTSVARASREGRTLIDYGFYRGVFFAVFCAFLLFATALIYRFTARQCNRRIHLPARCFRSVDRADVRRAAVPGPAVHIEHC